VTAGHGRGLAWLLYGLLTAGGMAIAVLVVAACLILAGGGAGG